MEFSDVVGKAMRVPDKIRENMRVLDGRSFRAKTFALSADCRTPPRTYAAIVLSSVN
jgi:hypothetical protein